MDGVDGARVGAYAWVVSAESLPPGPRGRVLTTLRLARDPIAHLPAWQARYGDPFTLGLVTGPVVVSGDPALHRALFTADPDRFGVYSAGSLRPILGEHSLLVLEGVRHRRERRLLAPPFHGARMRAYGEAIAAIAREALAVERAGRSFRALDLGQRISLEVILRTVFGVEEEGRLAEFRGAIAAATASAHPLALFVPGRVDRFAAFGPFARLRRDQERLCGLLGRAIADARGREGERSDILSRMLAARDEEGAPMSEAELVDELRTLLIAGHETTAIALAWALHWLHREPAALGRLRAELDALGPAPAPEAVAGLPYLMAVCQETLRLRPVVLAVVRRLVQPYEVAGWRLEPGVAVMASVLLTHRRAELYPEPERFRPERFLERSFAPHEHLPFGGGARRCLGAAFALYELQIALAAILGAAEFEPVAPRPVRVVRRNLTMGPGDGIPLTIARWRGAGRPGGPGGRAQFSV